MTDSPNSQQKESHLATWLVLGFLCLVIFSLLLPEIAPRWPPISIERPKQRRTVLERVRKAGGWEALRRDCISFVEEHKHSAVRLDSRTNGMPPAIAALHPQWVSYYPPELGFEESKVPVVRFKIFGFHSTGGHSTPYFGLEVAVGPEADTYRPAIGRSEGVAGNYHSAYATVTNNIYEIF